MPDWGEHIVVGLSGAELTLEERDLLAKIRPLGIIIFKHNIDFNLPSPDWCNKLRGLIDDAREATARSSLLVSVDHEGGRVHRFLEPVTHFPAALSFGDSAFEVGSAMGKELSALGFNVDFAPVLDVFSEPRNTVIGDRAFGTSAGEVATRAIEFAKGLIQSGIMPCGKHFPGHGSTVADSHFELPVLSCGLAELKSRELLPFIRAIESGVFPMLMSAHVQYLQIDSECPATFSESFLTNLLREEMGFEGVVITDDLGMMAVTDYSLVERGERALRAGADLLLIGNPKSGDPVGEMEEMVSGLEGGPFEKDLLASSKRIHSLVETICEGGDGLDVVGCEEHKQLLERLVR